MLQRLGYFTMMVDVPEVIVRHICKRMRIPVFSSDALKTYDESGSKSIHQRLLREYVGLRVLGLKGMSGWRRKPSRRRRPSRSYRTSSTCCWRSCSSSL